LGTREGVTLVGHQRRCYLGRAPGANVVVLSDVLCGALGVDDPLVGEGKHAGGTLARTLSHEARVIYTFSKIHSLADFINFVQITSYSNML